MAKSWSAREASNQPGCIGNFLTISHTCLPRPLSRWVSPCVLYRLMIGIMVVLLTFLGGGEYGFSNVEFGTILMGVGFKGKIMLYYSMWVKWEQGFTTGIGSYVYNVLGLSESMNYNGVVVNVSHIQFSDPSSIHGRGGFDLPLNVDIVNLLLKTMVERQKALFCYFCGLECYNCWWVGSGGLGQKILFRAG